MEKTSDQFEYEECEIHNTSLEADGGLVQYLGRWGNEGWELVEHKEYDHKHRFLFKRRVTLEKIDL